MRRSLDDHPGINANAFSTPPGVTPSHPGTALRATDPVSTYQRVLTQPPSAGNAASNSTGLSVHQPGVTLGNTVALNAVSTKPTVQRQPLSLIQNSSAEGRDMQGGVQYSVSQGFQTRVGSPAISQSTHGSVTPPSNLIPHHGIQAQAHQQQIIHQGQAHSQAHATQIQGAQQQQFQRLKVEDALSYLDQVKFKFGNQPHVYNDFLDIMKEFKSQSIDTPGVIQRVSNLFKGHPELIVGFNTFLPPGYKIEVSSNEVVNVVSIPITSAPSIPPITNSISVAPVHPSPNHSLLSSMNSVNSMSAAAHAAQSLTSIASSKAFQNASFAGSNSHLSQSHPHQNSSAPNALSGQNLSAQQTSQPVEFNHAINYVNKIKNRFQGQPDIYKQFLEILHTYQKEQRNIKEGTQSGPKPLTEAEVYSQVAKLFQNQEDLLQEFGQFLPDANGAANALVSLVSFPTKVITNDHTPAVKKPIHISKPTLLPPSNPIKQMQPIKRPSSLTPLPHKKPKMTSLKDVSLAEAGKYGTLNEFAFFDKARKALRSQEVYDNFLRCLVLYNQEILSRGELVHLISPFLGKFPELFKWFKDFLGYRESGNNIDCIPSKATNQEKERVTGELAMEIDYSSCKRYGASYRALPKNYVQPKCTGRTPLCKEVLNDTWVSFPSWSEDSTFVSSRKTQYEEYIYRCEDERFELDVVLETNLATIRALEAVQRKITRMTPEEKARLRLDDTLGGTSTVIHQRAIRRIYGDKSTDIIEGLKKNPVVAVPLVLRRLKAKEEEWREAQKNFNKIWRDQNEKYYLKSLDHQGITFKQNDIKYLRSKSILNEIETIFEERHEQADEGAEVPSTPHMTLIYKDTAILDDAKNLLIHHVKRQTGIHKEDKQKIKQLLRQFLPDFYSTKRGELSDDEMEKEDMEIDNQESSMKTPIVNGENSSDNGSDGNSKDANNGGSKTETRSKNNRIPLEPSCFPKLQKNAESNENSPINRLQNVDEEDRYTLFFVNNNWYLFFRLHNVLCERLLKIYERASSLVADEVKERRERKESTSLALRLKPKNEIEVEEYYTAFLEMVKNLLDGNIDGVQYEDTLRDMFGIHAYIVFTLDKVIQNAVRQLQHIVGDETCTQSTELFLEEQKNGSTGGYCSNAIHNVGVESAYQKKAEQILTDENCFKVIYYKKEGRLTVELLDTEGDVSEDTVEVEKWSEYVEKYVSGEDSISEDLKEQLTKKPVFLPRNVRTWRLSSQKQSEEPEPSLHNDEEDGNDDDHDSEPRSPINENEDKEMDSNDEGAMEDEPKLVPVEEKPEENTQEAVLGDMDVVENTQCKFNVNSYKMVFVAHSESYLYKRMALKRARQSHRQVSEALNTKFRTWHKKWLDENVSENQLKQCTDWFLTCGTEENEFTTICHTENPSTKPPYSPFNRYRVKHEDNR